jgi:hypothetical protein
VINVWVIRPERVGGIEISSSSRLRRSFWLCRRKRWVRLWSTKHFPLHLVRLSNVASFLFGHGEHYQGVCQGLATRVQYLQTLSFCCLVHSTRNHRARLLLPFAMLHARRKPLAHSLVGSRVFRWFRSHPVVSFDRLRLRSDGVIMLCWDNVRAASRL